MAFDPTSGSSGGFKRALVPYSNTSDLITAAEVVAGASAAIADGAIMGWKVSDPVESGSVLTFYSPANEHGVVYKQPLRGGIGGAKVSISAVFDKDPTGSIKARYPVGALIVADLLYHKQSNYGYKSVPLKISSVDTGTQAGANPADFSFTAEVIGVLPIPT